ncbi:MAG: prolyl-tRNA synthetase associated domain-containing protein [Eubacteriales bacterium]|nr:prolyl-tRNA synthetase associated domain-containing protein [Eubacteriales bacterium]
MKLVKGRPADETGRLAKEIRTYDLLDKLGIEYERVDHEAAETIKACEDVDKVLAPAVICKNLFLCNRQKTDFYLLAMPGEKIFKTKDLSSQIGSARLSFAGPEFMEEFLDITPGSVSVLGLMNDKDHRVKLLVDEEVFNGEYFGCHPCINTSSLRLKTKDVFETFMKAVGHDDFTVVKL